MILSRYVVKMCKMKVAHKHNVSLLFNIALQLGENVQNTYLQLWRVSCLNFKSSWCPTDTPYFSTAFIRKCGTDISSTHLKVLLGFITSLIPSRSSPARASSVVHAIGLICSCSIRSHSFGYFAYINNEG